MLKKNWSSKGLFIASLATLTLLVAGAANAVAMFDLTSKKNWYGKSWSTEVHGIELKLTAHSTDGREWVHMGKWGTGVYSYKGDSTQIDGWGPDERLRMHFSEMVHIVKVEFTEANGSGDDWSLDIDGKTIVDDKASGSGIWWANKAVFDKPGTIMDFYADHKNDDFKIKKIWVKKWEKPVPEPSAALVFGIGLLVASQASRRRR
ncbi:MAG: PEP-CTERM sorting domain-containing protein [Myxococcota bacterium]